MNKPLISNRVKVILLVILFIGYSLLNVVLKLEIDGLKRKGAELNDSLMVIKNSRTQLLGKLQDAGSREQIEPAARAELGMIRNYDTTRVLVIPTALIEKTEKFFGGE